MGRYVKNKELKSASYSIRLPYSNSAVGAECPSEGLIRYNYTVDQVQVYSNLRWRNLKTSEDIEPMPTKDTFYGDAENRVFGPMSFEYLPGEELRIFVYVQNVWQNPNVNYTVDGFYITFASSPPDSHAVVIVHGVA